MCVFGCACVYIDICVCVYVNVCTNLQTKVIRYIYRERDRERYSVSRYDSLIFNHETFTVLNQNCGMILVQNGEGFVSENQ